MTVQLTKEGNVMCDGIVCSNFAYSYLRCDQCPFNKVLKFYHEDEER